MKRIVRLSLALFVLLLFASVGMIAAQQIVPPSQLTPIAPPVQTVEPNAVPTLEPTPVQTQEAVPTEEVSAPQLRIDLTPLRGMELFAASRGPEFYRGDVTAGGNVFAGPEGCSQGYTSSPAALGMAWINASGPVAITAATDALATPVGILLWDVQEQRFYCTGTFETSNTLEMNNIATGIYFIWLVTEEQAVAGGILEITAPTT